MFELELPPFEGLQAILAKLFLIFIFVADLYDFIFMGVGKLLYHISILVSQTKNQGSGKMYVK